MKEHYEDDRCIIPEEIKKMSNEELQKKIAQFEQVGDYKKVLFQMCKVGGLDDGLWFLVRVCCQQRAFSR